VLKVAGPASISVAFILLIKFLLALPSLERLIGVRLSYSDEMKHLGLAYMLSGVILTSGGGYSINSMALVHKTGAKRLPAIFAAATNLLFVFAPGIVFAVVCAYKNVCVCVCVCVLELFSDCFFELRNVESLLVFYDNRAQIRTAMTWCRCRSCEKKLTHTTSFWHSLFLCGEVRTRHAR